MEAYDVAYMSRDKRREQIMNAVMDIVTHEGLAATTVRRIAQELACSPGQIHHLFASADALRAEAVREVWRRMEPELILALNRLPPRERLIVVLSGCVSSFVEGLSPIMQMAERLWKEAWDIRQEGAVREAVAESIGKMRDEIISTLEEGVAAGAFPKNTQVRKVTMRLIASSQGFDLLHEIGASDGLEQDKAVFIDDLLVREGL